MRIIDLDRDHVLLTYLDVRGCVKTKRRVPATVLPQMLPVEGDVGDDIRTVELQVKALPGQSGLDLERLAIPTNPPVVIAAPTLSVLLVPGMWQIDTLPRTIVKDDLFRARRVLSAESPICIQAFAGCSHRCILSKYLLLIHMEQVALIL
jgi:hypothetical protein